ncbi:MAG: hypothetical protein MK207_15650, partial [Saprospiraceae bacterium]|nr:hypothetical protein [Saprospiraceae bacterium]
FTFFCLSIVSYSQKSLNKNDALFVFRPLLFIDYNLYHWYKAPFNNNTGDVGQVFNVLPGIGTGIVLGKKSKFIFTLEVTFKYHPFSLNIEEFQGMGSLSLPILANFRIPLEGFFFFQFGGGIQFTQINLHQRTALQQTLDNSMFHTYVGEIAAGVEENLFLIFFLRFGYHPEKSNTFDFGLRLGLNGNLWE